MLFAPKPVFNSAAWNSRAIFSCAEMRRAEEITFADGTESFFLMQQAGKAAARVIEKKYKRCRVLVLCGPGNNGGDGFVVAEQLRTNGWKVTVAAMKRPDLMTGDAGDAAAAWRGTTVALEEMTLHEADLIVDALFGIGLSRPLEGVAVETVEKLAQTETPIVAIDLPSGVNGDTGAVYGAAVKATLTVTFFRKKQAHLLMPGLELCGEVFVTDIGIDDLVLNDIKPHTSENAPDLWLQAFPFPKPDAHKYERGHVLVAGGGEMTGAGRLAARAAQRMGAGLVTIGCPENVLPVYSAALESVIVRPADTADVWKELATDPKRDAMLIGPGLGLGREQILSVLAVLSARKPCVLDADALSNFENHPDDLFLKLNTECVLTPHEGEFKRLFGSQIDPGLDKISRVRKAAEIAGCIVLLKGADTVIADPDGFVVVNSNAPAWLATAGAGDVLAGMILGLIAQKMPPFAAAAAAVWIHGRVASNFGRGLIAEDLVDGLPAALQGLPAISKSV